MVTWGEWISHVSWDAFFALPVPYDGKALAALAMPVASTHQNTNEVYGPGTQPGSDPFSQNLETEDRRRPR